MVICPGIGNHSEKHYIRTFVDYAQKDGYRCAVLNHLGALPNIELTSPRMFTYGESKEGLKKGGYIEMELPLQNVFIISFIYSYAQDHAHMVRNTNTAYQ